MDKDSRSWECYLNLDNVFKTMITSLRSVGELQNQAIRDRHWEELIAMTKTSFVMSDSVQLKDLLALNLHHFEEEVKTIVDKAVKEQAMEKTLKELETIWSGMNFGTHPHDSSGETLLVASDELIEQLEGD